MKNVNNSKVKGQVMIITVAVLGSSLLIASTIAGYLMILQIRHSTDVVNSAKAIFAADSGVEWDLYLRYKESNLDPDTPKTPQPQMTNGSTFSVESTATSTKSIGESSGIHRAFGLTFE
ncbi:hypothetical protein HY227_02140 [Candidatus Wolfebacteria bacterium]|nr:hypothetical protein [Candidatus Wolfebacteria bacterium]